MHFLGSIIAIFLLCQTQTLAAQTLRETKLTASDGSINDTFGLAVALAGEYALIGANGDAGGRGAAYFFQRSPAAPFQWQEKQKLVARDGTAEDYFGFALVVTPDYALIGARNNDELGNSAGAVYVFRQQNSSWTQTAKLTARAGEAFDYFGNAVALSGDYALIGAPGERLARGAAYVFKRKTEAAGESWQEIARLQGSSGAGGDVFGVAVAWADSYAVIGAYGNDERGAEAGTVYFFQREQLFESETWTEKFKINAADGEAGDNFGVSLAVSGGYIIIGAYGDDDRADHSGAAYIFSRSESEGRVPWQQQAKLVARDGAANDDFGSAVAIFGEYALIGALMQYSQGKGAAYLFRRENAQWRELIKIEAGDAELNDRFGNAVALHNDCALVGARFEDEKGANAGAAYVYEGLSNLVSIRQPAAAAPPFFTLEQNYPNPFNPATTILFSLSQRGFVTLKIYDVKGTEIAVVIAALFAAGHHQVSWNAAGLASGVYFYRLQVGDFVLSKKLIIWQ